MSQGLLESLPPPHAGVSADVCAAVAASGVKVVVLDDDPTGTQTVHGIPVLTHSSVGALAEALAEPGPCFYVLTNSRAMPESVAVAVNRTIARNLSEAAAKVGRRFTIISRSDSTLRGHFPAEVDALTGALDGNIDNVLLIPAFFEGGRYTLDGIHYVADGDRLCPAAETEFARDLTFGYRSSRLADWVEEKSQGRLRAAQVVHLGIGTLRGPEAVATVERILLNAPKGTAIVVDAAAYGDLEVFVRGLLLAERAGRRFLARSAASYVRVRAGIAPRSLLSGDEITAATPNGGLIVMGSYVPKSTAQLAEAMTLADVSPDEIHVDRLGGCGRAGEIARVRALAERAIKSGRHALLFTSRELTSAVGRAGDLTAAQLVSSALVEIVRGIQERPRFFIAKGGITSSDLATQALGIKRALVLGQAAPGIPVWSLGAETRFPGMAYVVFPGNVGAVDTLRELICRLGGDREHPR